MGLEAKWEIKLSSKPQKVNPSIAEIDINFPTRQGGEESIRRQPKTDQRSQWLEGGIYPKHRKDPQNQTKSKRSQINSKVFKFID